MKISNYDNFINEKMGVALPAICYAEPIHDLTISEFTKYLESGSKKSNLKFEITSTNFADCISNKENYKKFPVVSILLNLFFIKISDDKFTKQYPNKAKNNIPHTVGGAAYKFGHKNWSEYSRKTKSIIEDLEFGIIIKLDGVFENIETSALNTGSYDWIVTDPPAEEAIIYISDYLQPELSGASSGFQILFNTFKLKRNYIS